MEIKNSDLPLSYKTIKVTQGRINKGLLAIPVSLIDMFPKKRGTIYLSNQDGSLNKKTFSPYSSSTRECRIGGLQEFYKKYSVRNGDELVIQKLEDNIYRLTPENIFSCQIKKLLNRFENSKTSEGAKEALKQAAKIADITLQEMIENEFIRLSNEPAIQDRKIKSNNAKTKREAVPVSRRELLRDLYGGRCQLTNFSFIMKNGEPYFEIHHINPKKGHHLKNLLVVSPNAHAQFTFADVELGFENNNPNEWLRTVKFNGETFNVLQKIDFLQKALSKEMHSDMPQ